MKIAYGNYGMPEIPYATVVEQIAEIGYDGLEICTGPRYATAPEKLTSAERLHLRQLMADQGLELDKLMINGYTLLTSDDEEHARNLDHLRRAIELGSDLGLTQRVAVNTAGGRIDDWETKRNLLVERAGDWARVAAEHDSLFALEPHVGAIVHSPDRTLWMLDQVDHPNLKINFDYSHFELIDVPLAEAIETLKPYIVGTHVKDVQGRPPDFRFLLPGEGEVNYVDYIQQMAGIGYDGFITVEISAHIFNRPGYDPFAAARTSYRALADAMNQAST